MKELNPGNHPVEFQNTSCPLCGKFTPHNEPIKIENPVLRLNDGFCPLEKLEYSLCRQDGLIYMNYRPAQKTLDWYYQNSPQIAHKSSRKIRSSNKESVRWLEKNIDLEAGDRVVDIGTNDGNFLYTLKKAGYEPAGIEPSDSAVKRLNNFYPTLDIYSGTVDDNIEVLERLNPRLICMIHLFEHLPEPLKLLRSLRSKTEARLFLKIPNGSGNLYPRITREHGHLYYYDQNSLKAIINKTGYKIEKIETWANRRTLWAIARPVKKRNNNLVSPGKEKQKLWQQTAVRVEEEKINIEKKTVEWKNKIEKNNFRVGLYGAGTDCYKWLRRLEKVRPHISTIFDRTPHFQGEKLLGIQIVPPNEKNMKKLDWLIITPRGNAKQIKENLPKTITRTTKIKSL